MNNPKAAARGSSPIGEAHKVLVPDEGSVEIRSARGAGDGAEGKPDAPPPVPERKIPWVTVAVMVASVGCTLWSQVAPEVAYAYLYASGPEVWFSHKWWGLFGSALLHDGFLHLGFNVYWLWIFGRVLERRPGRARYAVLLLVTAWFSAIGELAWGGDPGIGLSGVLYSFFGFMLVNRSRCPEFAAVLSARTIRLFVVWFFVCFALTESGVLRVANAAHASGLVSGVILGFAAYAGRARIWARAGLALSLGLSVLVLFWAPWNEEWRAIHTYRLFLREDTAPALVALADLRRDFPENIWAMRHEAHLLAARGEHGAAVKLYDEVLEKGEDAYALNNLAWIRATCPVEAFRDGIVAVRLSRLACEATAWQEYRYVNTLAMAHAEAGDFKEAEKFSDMALSLAGDKAAELRPYHESIKSGKPWREAVTTESAP